MHCIYLQTTLILMITHIISLTVVEEQKGGVTSQRSDEGTAERQESR